ncbi:hypothetical protein HY489_06065 [Candidatus Woesearchaeota archaeon]|nr:hypothetical protein [Candidatus Woesearchaeota archaeon]
MNQDTIEKLIKKTQLRKKDVDLPKIRALIESAEETIKATKLIPAKEILATTIFENAYKALKQIADAQWLLLGYESRSHDASMEIFKDQNDPTFAHVERFTTIRNDAYYRGYRVTLPQALDLFDFVEKHALQILNGLKEQTK